MASVTQTIPNYLGGVSNQPDDKKLPGQVTDALNAYPDPTFGLQKRPGLKFISELKDVGGTAWDNTDLDNGKWFYYNRDADERYVGCVTGASGSPYGQVHIWNAIDKTPCTINYHSAARAYLDAVNAEDYHVLTIRDTTIITNKQKVITTVAGAAHTDGQVGTVRIHLVEYSAEYSVTIHPSGASAATYTVNTRAGDTAGSDADTTGFLDAKEILTALKTAIDNASIANLTVTVIGSTLELSRSSGTFTLKANGGKGGESLTAYQNEVNVATELSGESINNRVVKIKNTNSSVSAYYVKFIAQDGTSGSGTWEETLKPGEETGLTMATMPHHLYSTAKNVFSFSAINGCLLYTSPSPRDRG